MPAIERFPEIRSLSRPECEAVLARHRVGRMAFTFHDRVDIQPLHYVYADGWINVRTSDGYKLTRLAHHPWVAFEVDEVRGPLDWISVVAHGTVYRVDDGAPHPNPGAQAEAVEALRTGVPEMFTGDDPVPHRDVVLRIAVKELSGRVATSSWVAAEGRDTKSY